LNWILNPNRISQKKNNILKNLHKLLTSFQVGLLQIKRGMSFNLKFVKKRKGRWERKEKE